MRLVIAYMLLIGYTPKQISEKLNIKLPSVYHYVKEMEKAKEMIRGLK